MDDLQRTKILSKLAPEDFAGRSIESDRLLRHAQGNSQTSGLLLLSAPASGVSELLRQTYDQLFYQQGDVIPFYFAIHQTDKTAENCAVRFLQDFLLQTVAFRRRDAKLLAASP